MKGFQIVRGKFSHAVAGLAVASLLGLAGCGGTAETPKKAALPTAPAEPLPGQGGFPKIEASSTKEAGSTKKVPVKTKSLKAPEAVH